MVKFSWVMNYLQIIAVSWDSQTHEKLDKDRFRRDLGNVEDAYKEVLHRLTGETL